MSERGLVVMGLLDNIRLAFASLWAGKMRALLTMLGIIIGIGSVIAILTVGDSLTGSINDSMQGLGVSNITVSLTEKTEEETEQADAAGVRTRIFGPSQPADEDLMTDEMIEEYRTLFGDRIAAISLTESLGSGTAESGDTSVNISATGVNLDFETAEGLSICNGRFLNERDLDGEKQVCVVQNTLCEELFGAMADPIGQTLSLTINERPFTFYIVGVYTAEEDGTVSLLASSTSYAIYLPLTTARRISGGADGYQSFTVVGSDLASNSSFLSDTEKFFASYYTRNPSWTVSASSLESMVSTVTEMISTVQLAIAAIAAISLLVGGIGVMNIMLVSITERIREIGTRKALGAPGWAIRLQFITESVVICLTGGIIGILLGLLLGGWAADLLGYAVRPSVSAMLGSAGFSMLIGIFFGYYPASKAAKLDPIDALRYE